MGGQTFNRSGVNLKVMLACWMAACQSPLNGGAANFARRTGQVSADLYEARSGRLVDQGLIVFSWVRTVRGCRRSREVKMIDMLGSAAAHERWSLELGLETGRQVKLNADRDRVLQSQRLVPNASCSSLILKHIRPLPSSTWACTAFNYGVLFPTWSNAWHKIAG